MKITETGLYDNFIYAFISKLDEYVEENKLYNESNTPEMYSKCSYSFALYQLYLAASDEPLKMDKGFLRYWNDFVGKNIQSFINHTMTPNNYLLADGITENKDNFWQNFLNVEGFIPEDFWKQAKKEIKHNTPINVSLDNFKKHIQEIHGYVLNDTDEEMKITLEFCRYEMSFTLEAIEDLRSLDKLEDNQELAGAEAPMEY